MQRLTAMLGERVAEILAKELNRDQGWNTKQVEDFFSLAKDYQLR